MTKQITHKWFFEHAPERVWDYLTKPELIAQWLMKTDFEPVMGHKFMFNTRPIPDFGFDGNIYCEVLEIVPFRRLTYSWKGGPGNGIFNLDSVVEWTLEKKDNGTKLLLEHKGFKVESDKDMYFLVMSKGWDDNVKKILQLIKG